MSARGRAAGGSSPRPAVGRRAGRSRPRRDAARGPPPPGRSPPRAPAIRGSPAWQGAGRGARAASRTGARSGCARSSIPATVPGTGDGEIALGGQPADGLPVGAEVHPRRSPGGRRFAEIDDPGIARRVVAVEQEPAAAEVPGLGVDDGEREGDRDRRVHGVAPLLEDLETDLGRDRVGADHHPVPGRRHALRRAGAAGEAAEVASGGAGAAAGAAEGAAAGAAAAATVGRSGSRGGGRSGSRSSSRDCGGAARLACTGAEPGRNGRQSRAEEGQQEGGQGRPAGGRARQSGLLAGSGHDVVVPAPRGRTKGREAGKLARAPPAGSKGPGEGVIKFCVWRFA